jgi:hypothetical protein
VELVLPEDRGLRAVFALRVELAAAELRRWAPFPLDDLRSEVWRTRAMRSSGNSDARAFAPSTTSFAWCEKKSLFTSAYSAAPDAGSSTHRVIPPFVE